MRFSREYEIEKNNILHPGAQIPMKEHFYKKDQKPLEILKYLDLPDGSKIDLKTSMIDAA